MLTKPKWMFLLALVLILLSSLLGCAEENTPEEEWEEGIKEASVVLNWFTMEFDTYGDQPTINVDFYLYEDRDPNSYIGTINFIKDGGEWRVDEFVDVTPRGGMSDKDITLGMYYFSSNLLTMLGDGRDVIPWKYGMPADFGTHTTYWNDIMKKRSE